MNVQPTRSPRQGSALLFAVVLLAVLSIGLTAFYKHLHRGFENHRRFEQDQITFYLAEAGVHKALARLRVEPDVYRGETGLALGDGKVDVAVTPIKEHRAYRIRSQAFLTDGVVTRAVYTLEVEAHLAPSGAITVTQWHREKKQS